MKISSVLAGLIVAVSAFVPMNVINNHEKCGLGLNQTRKICAACSVIGQLSMANQNRQMRLKLACLSLISNQCCSETTNRFLHWIFIQNTNDIIINWKKLFYSFNKSVKNVLFRVVGDQQLVPVANTENWSPTSQTNIDFVTIWIIYSAHSLFKIGYLTNWNPTVIKLMLSFLSG